MGNTSRRRSHLIAVAAAMALGAVADRTAEANQYWDTTGATTGTGATPTGTWGVDHFWSASAAGTMPTAAWTLSETAVFSAGTDATGAYTVGVFATQDAGGLRFEDGAATLSGGTINLTGSTVVAAATGTANTTVINSVLTGASGLALTRVGTTGVASLSLSGGNTYTGQTLISAGSIAAQLSFTLLHNDALGATGAGNGTAFATSGSAGAFVVLPGNRVINEEITVTAGATASTSAGQLRVTGGVNTWAGNIVVNGGANTTGTGLVGIGGNAGTLVITGVISSLNAGANTAGVAWAKTGTGTVVLRGANTNVGFTRLFNGTLVVEADGALGTPSVDGSFDAATLQLANNQTTIAFNAPPASSGFAYTVHEGITTAGPAAGLGVGADGNAQLDNFGGSNTFAGFVRVGGASVSGPARVIASMGAVAGSSLELSGDLYGAASGAGTVPNTADAREIHKLGSGTLIISGANTAVDGVTSGDSDQYRLYGDFIIDAGTVTLRSSNASGGVLLGNSVGPMNFTVNAGTTLALDNSLAANNARLASNAVVTVSGGELKLVGNASTSVTQTLANPSVTGDSTITVSQPTSGNGSTTTLKVAPSASVTMRATTLNLSAGAKLDLSDNKLIAAGQDRGTWNGTTYTGVSGLVVAGRGDGTWNGSEGITTSMSDATSSVLTTLAVASADETGYAGSTFGGVSVSSGDTIVFYTWGGDADLNGELNGDDYFFIDSNILAQASGYHNGDFDYNGVIDGDDYFILDSNILFAQGSGYVFPHGAGSTGSPQAGAGGLTSVPEPGAVGVIVAVVGCAMRRRRGAALRSAPP